MRYSQKLMIALVLLFSVTAARAEVSIDIRLPGVSIGINQPVYPELVAVPGYPVYYAPNLDLNFFFYDGLYWVYHRDNWYASDWYNGPWGLVAPEAVPLFVLRIPVGYYRNPPRYFYGWHRDAPPRWGVYWGPRWEQHRRGWDRWDRRVEARPAPLPQYQRQYSGDRYPRADQQRSLHDQNYRYQPREVRVRQHDQERSVQRAAAAPDRREERAVQRQAQPAPQMAAPRAQSAPQAPQPLRQERRVEEPRAARQSNDDARPGRGQPQERAQENRRESRDDREYRGRGEGRNEGRGEGRSQERGR